MNQQRIFGIVLIVGGVILLIVGLNAKDSVADRLSNFFTGSFTDATVWYLVGGVVLTLGGIALAAMSGSKSSS